MKIKYTFDINDEPHTSVSTGKRQATITYTGPRFLYVEVCSELEKALVVVHSTDSEPDLDTALERLSAIDSRSIIEIDGSQQPLVASIISGFYSLEIPDYEEELPNGTVYKHAHCDTPDISEIFNIHSMKFDIEKKDFVEYLYHVIPTTKDDMVVAVEMILEKVEAALADPLKGFTDEEVAALNTYKDQLNAYITDIETHDHWKIDFPFCSTPY